MRGDDEAPLDHRDLLAVFGLSGPLGHRVLAQRTGALGLGELVVRVGVRMGGLRRGTVAGLRLLFLWVCRVLRFGMRAPFAGGSVHPVLKRRELLAELAQLQLQRRRLRLSLRQAPRKLGQPLVQALNFGFLQVNDFMASQPSPSGIALAIVLSWPSLRRNSATNRLPYQLRSSTSCSRR